MKTKIVLMLVLVTVFGSQSCFAQTSKEEKATLARKLGKGGLQGWQSALCLDGIIPTLEEPFHLLSKDNCSRVVSPLPLAHEDALWLEGRSPDDGKLLEKMEVQSFNAQTLHISLHWPSDDQQETRPDERDRLNVLIGEVWAGFQQNRDTFCAHHPKLYVFDLGMDGVTTDPKPCSKRGK